jgi:uncharacterized protein
MSPDPFPEHTDTSRLFARNGSVSAVLPLAKLERLVASLADPGQPTADQVSVDLAFGHDEEGRRRLTGSLQTSVMQLCQRCLQPMQQELHCELDLLVLDSEEELKALPEAEAVSMDVIVGEAGELDLLAVIEDELLLSMPLVPMHEDTDCSAVLTDLKSKAVGASGEDGGKDAGKDGGEGRRTNPFAALAALKPYLKQDKNGNDTP